MRVDSKQGNVVCWDAEVLILKDLANAKRSQNYGAGGIAARGTT